MIEKFFQMCSLYCFWIKKNSNLFFSLVLNGIFLYILVCFFICLGRFSEAKDLFEFPFCKVLFLIFSPSILLQILFVVMSFITKGFFLDMFFIFLCKQFNSLSFFVLQSFAVAIGFYLFHMLRSVCEGNVKYSILILLFICFVFICGSFINFLVFLFLKNREHGNNE